jgi:hypothetical protein
VGRLDTQTELVRQGARGTTVIAYSAVIYAADGGTWAPMAVVILGGLFTSTLLNLFVVPSLYLRFGRSTPKAPEPEPVPA